MKYPLADAMRMQEAMTNLIPAQRCSRARCGGESFRLHLMSYIKQMFAAHPVDPSSDRGRAIECITAAYSSAEACNVCADACLSEEDPAAQIDCIRTSLDCADICLATARIVSRMTRTNKELVGAQLRACHTACEICAAECGKDGDEMEHCRICAEACRRCAKACSELLND